MFKRSFYYLWGTQTVSNAADVLYLVALTTFVLNGSGSIIFATLIPFFRVMAQLISGILAPLMVVRYRLPFLLLISQTGQFFLFGGLALYMSPWIGGDSLPVIFTSVIFLSFLDGWTTPSRNALIPRLVDDGALLKANGLVAISDQVVQFAGWAISGLLVSQIGSFPTLMIVAVGYGLAMVVTARIEDPTEPPRRNLWDWRSVSSQQRGVSQLSTANDNAEGTVMEQPSRWHTLREGWLALWHSPRLRALTIMDMTDMLGGSVWVGAFMLLFVKEVLLKDEQWWGYINASYFAGAVLGGILVVALVNRLEKRLFMAMLTGMVGYAVLIAIYALNTSAPMALLIVVLMGPMTELSAVSRRTMIQRSTSKDMLPKVLSAQAVLLNLILGVSLLFMSWVAEQLGIMNMYLVAGGISLLAGLFGWLNRKSFSVEANREELGTNY
ncbi:MAG TPA: MFS transporter [Paenibacillus sp.]|jgi:hypothetical protein